MPAPPIDARRRDQIAAWIELLASCERAVPGPGLAGAILDRDVVDPADLDPGGHGRVVARAGTTVDAELAGEIGRLGWLSVADLLVGSVLATDIANPATARVHRAGTVVDDVLARVLEDLARITGPQVLVGCALGVDGTDLVDAELAEEIDRRAWVRIRSWRLPPDGRPDAGRALAGVASRFAELVVERLNRAADKHELAFLDLVGTEPLPPRPARVPLTFTLAAGSPVEAVVPAGTQAAASLLEGEVDEVVFETERNLVVTRSRLQAVFVGDAETDSYSDRTAEATGGSDRPFAVFGGDQPVPHQLFVACDELLTRPGTWDVTLTIATPSTWPWANWPISWAYLDGTTWQPLDSRGTASPGAWRVMLRGVPQLAPGTVDGREAGWLRAQLDIPLPPARSGLVPESVASGARPPQRPELPLAPFGETTPTKWFYLSADEAIGTGPARLRIGVELERAGAGTGVTLDWTYRVGREWRPLELDDGTRAFTRDGEISFHVPPMWPRELYRGRIGRWLRVEVTDDGVSYTTLPRIRSLTVGATWDLPRVDRLTVQVDAAPAPLPAAAGAFNGRALDLSKDFHPFGEQPRFNDTFHLALPDEAARPGAGVELRVTLTNPAGTTDPPAVLTSGRARLAWEVWDGHAWCPVTVVDQTSAFTTSGTVRWTLPPALGPTTVAGVEGHWLRARLVAGNYGTAAAYTTATDDDGNTVYHPVPASYAPPVIKASTLGSTDARLSAPPSSCLTHNDFTYADRTAEATTGGFTPFTPSLESEPALYLGFDRPFAARPVTLYLQVEPPAPEDVAADRLAEIDPTTQARIAWEYAAPDGWRPLGALDETRTLTRRGLVGFVGPDDLTARSCFGRTSCWLRVRWQSGYFPLPPQLRRVLPDTTWAVQATTVDGEILGAGSGQADQVLTTARSPVQPGQQVTVREPDEVWVPWHQVPDLHGSGPHDRHYTLDPLTGALRFGDGQRGLLPPPGPNNVRIRYRTGGGAQGNRAAGTIVQLRSGIPYVDGVINHEPAQGGEPREPIDRIRVRGPRALRHRDRAVTAQDIGDLAFAASAGVARAVAIAPTFDPTALWLDRTAPRPTDAHRDADAGRVGVIVVPTAGGGEARPTPGLALLGEVEAYLQERCPPTVDVWVAGPEWVRVTVTVAVAATSLDLADALGPQVQAALGRFLHPLAGGPLGDGWAFGRKPHRSDLFALVEAVPGVDHVTALTMAHEPETQDATRRSALRDLLDRSLPRPGDPPPAPDLQRWLDRALVYSGDHRITVSLAT